jgi:hypothetical protein
MEYHRRSIQRHVGTDPDDYSADDLSAIANGPLCDALRAFCPAGRLTTAQMLAREAAQWEQLS